MLLSLACESSNENIININFNKVDGYFVSNKTLLNSGNNYLYIESKAKFDNIFIPMPYPFDPNKITKVDFSKNVVIAVIKNGRSYWEIEPIEVKLGGNILHYKYSAVCVADSMSWGAVIPNIIEIEKTYFSGINYYENNEYLFSIDVK